VRGIFAEGATGRTVGEAEELCLATTAGAEAFVRFTVSPLPSREETVVLQVIALDVTDQRRLRTSMEYYITQITRAQEDERLRISRELHDETAQVLAGLSRDIASLTGDDEESPPSMADRLSRLRDTADSALEGVRRFSQDLRPSVLDDLGLIPALEWLAANLERQHGITASISVTGQPHRLPPEKELIVFRVAQEALGNARRHSRASTVAMTVDLAGERVEQRIAGVLVMLSTKLGETLPFTRQEIADMSGTTTETAIRVMSDLRNRGIIRSTRGKVTVLDADKLRLLSGGHPQV